MTGAGQRVISRTFLDRELLFEVLTDLVRGEEGAFGHGGEFAHVPGAFGFEKQSVEHLGGAAAEAGVHVGRAAGGYRFTGRGLGHGLGMCQWGAVEVAAGGVDADAPAAPLRGPDRQRPTVGMTSVVCRIAGGRLPWVLRIDQVAQMVNNLTVTTVNLAEAKAHLSEYVQRVEQGETIILARRNRPVAELRPVPRDQQGARPIGLCEGEFQVPDDFDAPLPDSVLDAFEGK